MAEPQSTIRNVAWNDLFPWLILFRSVRIALMARVLIIGAVGLIVTALGWQVIGWIYHNSTDPVVSRWNRESSWLWEQSSYGLSINTSAQNAEDVLRSASADLHDAPVEAWRYLTQPFQDLFNAQLTASGFICMMLACLWELFVWGIAGGAISRIAALKFTRDESLSPATALRQTVAKLPSYSLAPLVALAGAAVFAVQLFVLGLLMNLSLFAMLAAFIWPFVLVLGLLMSILLIGALVGWPLMWATVSVEGTDAFDALSRSYAYVYQRPWRLLWYVAFSVFLAAISMFVVKGFATSAIALGNWSVSWGLKKDLRDKILHDTVAAPASANMPPAFVPPPGLEAPTPPVVDTPTPTEDANQPHGMLLVAHRAIDFWQSLWKAVAAGFQVGYVWVSAVGIYLLLRRDIDGAEMDEVYIEQQDEFGMPALEEDAPSGVPAVSSSKPAQPGDSGPNGQRPAGAS